MEPKSILGLLIASAIPVVMFALWCEYFRNDVETENAEGAESSEDEVASDRLARVRLAGLMSTVLQLIVFLSTGPIRQEDATTSIAGLAITLVALVTQRSIQIRLEQEILPKTEPTEARDTPSLFPTGLFWAFAGMAVYFGVLSGCVLTSAMAVAVFHLEGATAFSVIGLGALAGYTGALASNFLLSSWFFKRLVPSEEITSPEVLMKLDRWFAECHLVAPEFRTIRSGSVKSSNAWVTGFPTMKGPFRPVLWLTPRLLEDFSRPELHGELEAIIKHEAAHMNLKHLSQRFFLSWLMSLVVLATMAASLALNTWFNSHQVSTILPLFSMAAALTLLFQSFRVIQRQGRRHELEADRYCVEKLGARASELISALKRIEECNSKIGNESSVQSPTALGSHPAVEERIAALQPLADAECPVADDFNIAA